MTIRLMTTASLATVLALTTSAAFAAKSPQDFMKDTIQGDNSEIALGKMAEQKADDQRVKQLGQMLVTDHTQAKDQATSVAKTLNVTPPDGIAQEAQDEQTKLSKMSGDAFDKEFVNFMISDHQKDISEFQDQASANNGPASELASKQLPVLKKHLEMAKTVAANDQSAATTGGTNVAASATQDAVDDWRASKLVGVDIYGPDDKKVGDITDIMMSKDGKAEFVVIGVGGFLGLGEKDVAIPYDQVKFTAQPLETGAAASGSGVTGNATGTATGNTTATGRAAATDNVKGTAPMANDTAMVNSAKSYPNHGMIQMTAAQLKAAPTFKFPK
jgi:putative membrane protein